MRRKVVIIGLNAGDDVNGNGRRILLAMTLDATIEAIHVEDSRGRKPFDDQFPGAQFFGYIPTTPAVYRMWKREAACKVRFPG